MQPAMTDEFFARLTRINPDPKSELDFKNPFTLLVAVVLSAQATDVSVNKATRDLFRTVDSPAAMLDFGEDALRQCIRTIGLFNTKARNVVALSRQLLERFEGRVPMDRKALESLPGVGRKSANVVLNVAFDLPVIAVDTHVFRVANRTGLAPGKTPLEVEAGLEAAVPGKWKLNAHHWLILHGRHICTARKPACLSCPVGDLCQWTGKTRP